MKAWRIRQHQGLLSVRNVGKAIVAIVAIPFALVNATDRTKRASDLSIIQTDSAMLLPVARRERD